MREANPRAAKRELAEIGRRRELLRGLPPFSRYDETIIAFDAKRHASVAASLRGR